MISVNMLSSYLYCKRKLYLQYVLKISPIPKEAIIWGRLKHDIFDKVNSLDKEIVSGISNFMPLEEIIMVFRKEYSKIFFETLETMKDELIELGVDSTGMFHKMWPMFLREARDRAANVYGCMVREKVYGESLWSRLSPKILTEVTLSSYALDLKGAIDRIEIHNGEYTPIELKSGRMPKEGVWPGDRIQLESYMSLLVEEMHKNIKEGYVHYIDHDERRKISMNPFVRENVIKTVQNVNRILNGKLPPIVSNKNKCSSCSFRDKCYSLTGS
ncbi:CRISPR-associated protein Cas4 [archaeon]|jgi:CRISPR-associated exonuclease Cas4|nr:CRISPR-associated protein Cas4 [archaeon]MBT6824163.1 CRISPR-associated protein Cas4 [archaeon]MBT7106993.1 CRISPR-associated protein Cas4 [archaeon]MBT7297605.1 CRISPR-associated protein Cas4 [archaeon]